jgi:ATP-binding cassette subfamily B protein
MKVIVDAVATGIAATDKGAAFKQVGVLIGLTGTVNLANAVCGSIAELVSTAQAQIVTNYMYGILHAKAIEVDLEYYENSEYYDILQRAQQEAYFRPTRILNNLLYVGQNGISLIGLVGLLFWFHWGLAAILFIATVPGIFVRLRYTGEMYRWKRKRTATERQATYLDWMLTNSWYAKEIRLFDLGSLFSRRFRKLRQQLYQESFAIATKQSLEGLITQTSATLAIYGSYAFIAYQTVRGTFTLGDLVMYYQAFQRGQDALRGLWNGLSNLYEDNLFLFNLHEFLDLKPKIAEPLHPKPVPQLRQIGIKFERVGFQYPSSTRKGLEDITLIIRPGEVVALVGENGAGKTTLIKLLCRLYDPTEGSISFEGVPLHQFTTTDLRRQISVVFQDYAKYYLTAKENIWFGNIDHSPDDRQIEEAARKAGADSVIAGLPKGYETMLGNWFEEGEELSIGQWQKIALARAFLRDAQLIVLDEPTSALDAQAEAEVFEKFRQLAKGRSAILISHRLSTVKMADHIYVLEKGRIVESGTHDKLIQLGGTYAHLFETQAQHYR